LNIFLSSALEQLSKVSQISEKYWGEVGKGKRADIYLEVRKRRGHIFFEWNKCLCFEPCFSFCIYFETFNSETNSHFSTSGKHTLPRYFSFRLPHLNIPTGPLSDRLDTNIQRLSHGLLFSHWNRYSHFRSSLNWFRKFKKRCFKNQM
jgi:hypothetical protein